MAGNQGHPLWFKVITPSGPRPIRDLRPGDEIFAGDGSITQITSIIPLGERQIYNVAFDGGNIVVPCTDDHLWMVRSAQRKRWSIENTLQVAARKMKPRTPACGALRLPERDLPLDPYLLGVLLGDGSFCNTYVQVSSLDVELLRHIQTVLPDGCELKKRKGARSTDWNISTLSKGRGRRNPVMERLELLGLRGLKSAQKYVPFIYLMSSATQRLGILRGLMDTDGYAQKRGNSVRNVFTTTSEQLASDVAFLCRSLGGQSRINKRSRLTYKNPKTGERAPCLDSYYVAVRLNTEVFELARKRKKFVSNRKTDTLDHIWEDVELCGTHDAACISVAHPSRLYICDGFIVTHNCGKTLAGGNEHSMHATGEYPDWWDGRVFSRPIMSWAAGVTSELTRDGVQRFLMGRFNELGTGTIPKWRIRDHTMKRGVAGAVDTLYVRWGGGGDVSVGDSTIQFKSYDQGREKFQQESLDVLWFDEEPEYEIYSEGLTRTNATGGMVFMTFTPLQGMTQTVMRFTNEKRAGTHVTHMTIDDADHFSAEQKQVIISSYPAHEQDARIKGVPMLGSGRVFPVIEDSIRIDPIPLPPHWPKLAAMDFGYDHPTAIVWIAWDRDTDTVYVYDCYRMREALVPIHAAVLIGKGQWIPVAWPHDGNNDTAIGPQLAKQYRDAGVNMLDQHAQYDETGGGTAENTKTSRISVEAGVADMLTRMRASRFKVFSHLNDWFEEFRMYHRKDGKIVKLADDLLSATRYSVMSLRFAETEGSEIHLSSTREVNWRTV